MFLIKLVIIFTTLSLFWYTLRPSNKSKYALLIGFTILFILQLHSTRLATIFEYSGMEKYLIDIRHNFSPLYVRYIDPPQFYRYREYLFSSMNFVKLTDVISIYLTPFFLVGLFAFIKKPVKLISILLIAALILLSFVSPNGKYGPILLTPFIYFLTFYAIRLVKK